MEYERSNEYRCKRNLRFRIATRWMMVLISSGATKKSVVSMEVRCAAKKQQAKAPS
jgi:hypothetical protein